MKNFEEGSEQPPLAKRIKGASLRWALPLAVACALSTMPRGGLGLLIQLYLKNLNSSPLLISLAASVGSIGILLGGLFWGTLSDSRRRKPLLFILLGAGALALGVQALLLPPTGVLVGVFFVVFMLTGFIPIAMAIISQASSLSNRGRNLSAIHASRSLGFMLGGAMVGFVLQGVGFRWGFGLFAVLPFLAIAFIIALPGEQETSPPARRTSVKGLAKSGLGPLYLAVVLRLAGVVGAHSLRFVHMASLGIAEGAMGMARATNHALQVPAMLLFGQLADRVGRRGIFVLGFGLSALVPVVFGVADSAWGMAAGFLILGVAFSALYVGSTAHIGDCVPAESQGAMLGLYESSRGLGGVLGPLIAGAIAPVVGFRNMFFVMAGIAATGFLLVVFRRDRTPRVSHSDLSIK